MWAVPGLLMPATARLPSPWPGYFPPPIFPGAFWAKMKCAVVTACAAWVMSSSLTAWLKLISKMFQDKGVKKIITQCPHCFSVLKNDYRQYGASLEVIHHSELLNQLIQEGKLKLNTLDLGKVVFHDSCYLGRHNGIYQSPRQALTVSYRRGGGGDERHRNNGFCCGAGAGACGWKRK